jgi:hypothetical protein
MTNLIFEVLPRFPAHVDATNGLKATVDGVDVVVTPDYGALVPVPAVTNPSSVYLMAWDQSIDYYQSISFTDLVSNVGDFLLVGTIGALNALTMAANQGIYFSGPTTAVAYSLSSFVRGVSGSADAATFRTGIGLGNVDNTSDANKPVSTAQQTALNLKANLASPTFTGSPAAPTPAGGNNSTLIATTAYVQGELTAKAPLASPTFTGDPKAPTPSPGDNDTSIATTAFVAAAIAALSSDVKAWVNFNGTGTVAINASKNVSSITDNGVGDYTINFTSALANANYGVVFGGLSVTTTNHDAAVSIHGAIASGPTTKTTSALRISVGNVTTATLADMANISAAILG